MKKTKDHPHFHFLILNPRIGLFFRLSLDLLTLLITNSETCGPAGSPARQCSIDAGDRGRGERSQSRAQVAPTL